MTLEEQLKQKILEQYRSVRAFTTAIGVSYSTLDSALKREHGIKNAGIFTMLKIFDALDLDIESVKGGELKSKEHLLALTQCSSEAATIAAAYDRADDKSRKMARLALEDFIRAVPEAEPPQPAAPKNVRDWTDAEMHASFSVSLTRKRGRRANRLLPTLETPARLPPKIVTDSEGAVSAAPERTQYEYELGV